MTDPIADRRQRAREAAYDAVANSTPYYQTRAAMEAAIEVATQVKITNDIIHAAAVADTTSAIKAAFRAAGFEVVE